MVSDLYLGDPERALTALERYKELTGEDRPVTSWIAELRQRTGKPPLKPPGASTGAKQPSGSTTPADGSSSTPTPTGTNPTPAGPGGKASPKDSAPPAEKPKPDKPGGA